MSAGQIVILTPTRREAAGVRRALRRAGGSLPEIIEIGVGGAALRADDLHLPEEVRLVVLVGVAGGLDPDCRPGDVLVEGAPAGFGGDGWRAGRIHSSDAIVATPAQKRRLFEASGCQVVDMEHAAVARVLPAGVELCGVRAVMDGADEALSPALADVVDERGRVRLGRLLGALGRAELSIGTLWWLSRRSNMAIDRAGEVVARLVAWAQAEPESAGRQGTTACLST